MITAIPDYPLLLIREMHAEAVEALRDCPAKRLVINPEADDFEFIDLKLILPELGYQKRHTEGFCYYEYVLKEEPAIR